MENKFTDNKIIKALECCKSQECGECSRLYNDFPDSHECKVDLMEKVYSLINCQKAEIERLNVELVGMRGACESYKIHYDNAKTEIERLQKENSILSHNADTAFQDGLNEAQELYQEQIKSEIKGQAIKEFAERLKKVGTKVEGRKGFEGVYVMCSNLVIDNLVKEMEGEDGLN